MRKEIYHFSADDARRFAHEQGMKTRERGNELQFEKCPYCKYRTDDKNTFAINLRTGQFKCLRATCGAKGNMLTLARDFDFSINRDVDEYYNPRRRYRDLTRYPKPTVRTPAVEYLEGRGISKAITESYSITTQKDNDDVLVFPFFDDEGKMQFIKYRNTKFKKDEKKGGSKEWTQTGCKPILFGMDHCDPQKSDLLIITEGQIDSLSLVECGLQNVVSVPTGAQGFTWVPYCWDFLCKFKTLIVFGDYEKGRITLLSEMTSRFVGRVMHVRIEDYQGCKDANELMQAHGKQAVIDAVNRAVPVANELIKSVASIVRDKDEETIDTGFKTLDKILDGFHMKYLTIITGERGYGKSTLASQFIVKALEQNMNCFCYSGELDGAQFQEWIDRQAAGDGYTNPIINRRGKKNYIVRGDAGIYIHRWYDNRLFLYDNTVIRKEEKILETVQKAITQYDARVILLDNLMTAMIDEDPRSDANEKQTAFVAELAEMSKRFKVLIFLIAHPRKMLSGRDFSNDDILGSSNIANLADVILRYTKPKDDDDRRSDRILQVTKNRKDGEIYLEGIPLWYEASSKRITDVKGMFGWRTGWEKELENEDGFMALPEDEDESPW